MFWRESHQDSYRSMESKSIEYLLTRALESSMCLSWRGVCYIEESAIESWARFSSLH